MCVSTTCEALIQNTQTHTHTHTHRRTQTNKQYNSVHAFLSLPHQTIVQQTKVFTMMDEMFKGDCIVDGIDNIIVGTPTATQQWSWTGCHSAMYVGNRGCHRSLGWSLVTSHSHQTNPAWARNSFTYPWLLDAAAKHDITRQVPYKYCQQQPQHIIVNKSEKSILPFTSTFLITGSFTIIPT